MKWTIPPITVAEDATLPQRRSMLYAMAPRWLVDKGAVFTSGTQIDVFDGESVKTASTGDTLELVDDEAYGTVVRIVQG